MAMGHVEGLVVADLPAAERLTPAVRRRLGHAMAMTLAKVHDVDLRATGLEGLASHEPYAARQLRRWRRQADESSTELRPPLSELAERLEAGLPDQQEATLVHGDFHLGNVIAAPDGERIRTVLDWELCTLGDPVADLGSLMAATEPESTSATPPSAALPPKRSPRTSSGRPRRSRLTPDCRHPRAPPRNGRRFQT